MEILEPGIGRGGEGRRQTGHEFRSRMFRLDPIQNFGVWAVAFYRGYQCSFLSSRMRKKDVPCTICSVQLLSLRGQCDDIRSNAGSNSVGGFLWKRIQKCTPKVDGFPKVTRERMVAQRELRPTVKCSPHCPSSGHQC